MAAAPSNLVGTTIGDYTLKSILAESPAGVLYAAYHEKLQREAACRVLSATAGQAKEQVASALAVARTISRLRHPNLIDIYDYDELPDGKPYLIMTLLGGTRLSQAMQQRPLSAGFVVSVIEQICAGLQAAHTADVAHLYLSPRSVFVNRLPSGQIEIKLTDFGEWGVTQDESARYQSPEQKSGKPGNARSDIYALGCIVYELCAGQPYEAAQLGPGVPSQPLLPKLAVQGLAPDTAARLDPVLRRALSSEPAARQSSVEVLGRDLLACLPHSDSTARHSQSVLDTLAPRGRTMAQLRRRRNMIRGVALSGALCALGAAAYFVFRAPPKKPPPIEARIDPLSLHALSEQVLVESLRSSSATVRKAALQGLSQSRDPRYEAWIEPLLDDSDPTVQAAAARALSTLGAPLSIAALRAHTGESLQPEVRQACAEALHKLGDATGTKQLKSMLSKPPSPELELRAALALLGNREGEQALRRRMKQAAADSDEVAQILTQRALHGDSAAQQDLEKRLPEASAVSDRQLEIAGALTRLGSAAAQKLLSSIAAVAGASQTLAAKLLCDADDPTAQVLLREAVSDGKRSAQARALAARGLGACGDRTDAALLARLMRESSNEEQRLALAEAVLRLTGSDPSLLAQNGLVWAEQAIADERFGVRESAARLLGDIDLLVVTRMAQKPLAVSTAQLPTGKAAPAVPDESTSLALLTKSTSDEDPRVRLASLRAIGQQGLRLRAESGTPASRIDLEPLRAAARARTTGKVDDERERLRAAVTLEQLGDVSAVSILTQALKSTQASVRQVALEEIPATSQIATAAVAELLSDKDSGVRFRAASFLAQRKDNRAEPILRETMNQGGSDGLVARSLLLSMGTSMPVEHELPRADQIDEALASADPLTRLAALELVLRLPHQQALPLLEKVAHDSDSILRFRVSAALSSLLVGSGRAVGLRLLQRMLADEDAAVRASAGLILSHDYETVGKQRGEQPLQRRPQKLPPPSLANSSEATAADDNGLSEAERKLSAQLKAMLAQSAAAMAKRDLAGAEAVLLKAESLCRRQPKASKVCGRNLPRIVFQLATVHEKQEKWSLAQNEYQRVRDQASAELRNAAKAAIARLSKQLGQLIVWKTVGKACKRVELWMPAGTHKFSDSGQTKSVQLSAGQQVEVRLCKK